jgi:hypothetical protein
LLSRSPGVMRKLLSTVGIRKHARLSKKHQENAHH